VFLTSFFSFAVRKYTNPDKKKASPRFFHVSVNAMRQRVEQTMVKFIHEGGTHLTEIEQDKLNELVKK